MKKLFVFAVCLFVCSVGYAETTLTGVTVDWGKEVAMGTTISCAAFNYTTNHFLICDYSTQSVKIADSDGNLTGGSLSTSGVSMGTLAIFAICVAEDGVIYGGGNPDPGDGEKTSLIRWANESAVPTEQLFTRGTGDGEVNFPRAMDAVGSGADTVVAITGDNTYSVSLLTTTDGVNFTGSENVVPVIVSGVFNNLIKQGVALDPALDRVFGTKADGSGEVVSMIKSATDDLWYASAVFSPSRSYDMPPDGFGGASPIGFLPGHNAVMVAGVAETDDTLTVLDADTGEAILQTKVGYNVAAYGYGAIDADEDNGVAYLGSRASLFGSSFGSAKISFDPPPTPTPTPTISSGVLGYQVYE